MSKVWYFSPYSLEKNLGKEYNTYCNLVPNDNDWIALVDGDTAFLQTHWGNHIQDLVNKYPEAGIITCLTNRVGQTNQCFGGQISEDPNVLNHIDIQEELLKVKRLEVKEFNHFISGHLMIFRKSTWKAAGGFPEVHKKGPEYPNILTVDNRFSFQVFKKLKMPIYVARGLYLFHIYRFKQGIKNREHLTK